MQIKYIVYEYICVVNVISINFRVIGSGGERRGWDQEEPRGWMGETSKILFYHISLILTN